MGDESDGTVVGTGDTRVHVADLLRQQAGPATGMTATLLRRLADDVEAGGESFRAAEPIARLSHADAPGLGLLAAAHRLALAGEAPGYAGHLPTCGGDGDIEGAWAALRDLCSGEALVGEVLRPVQTNEPGRLAALLPGLSTVAAATRLPLRLLEVGSSAGLLLRFDRYRYDIGGARWGEPDSTVHIRADADGVPQLVPVEVESRRGCDPNPVDPVIDRLVLLGFIWPDNVDRFTTAAAALDLAARVPVPIDAEGAATWLGTTLADTTPGVTTVVFHSIVWQYLSGHERQTVRQIITAAGQRASAEAPLAWLTFEPHKEPLAGAELGLRIWPDGHRRSLALCGYHGNPVHWHHS